MNGKARLHNVRKAGRNLFAPVKEWMYCPGVGARALAHGLVGGGNLEIVRGWRDTFGVALFDILKTGYAIRDA